MQAQLRRKLWTLWGNVEELKSEGQLIAGLKPANHPFECCIAEYGVWDENEHNGDWKRVHRIFQTTIRD
jgi:protection-of-telomeres protein 1